MNTQVTRILALMRAAGYDVSTEWRTTPSGKRIAVYRLNEAPRQLTLDVA